MKQKSEVIKAVTDAYRAIQNLVVVSVPDCRRKILINDSLEYAIKLLENEHQIEDTERIIPEETNGYHLCEPGQTNAG